MPVGFTIKLDDRALTLALANVKNGVPRAVTRAINRTLTTVRAAAAREVAEDIGVPVRQVTERMDITKATFNRLAGRIRISGTRIPLVELRPAGPEPSRGKGRGVSYSLGGQRRRIHQAFLATMRSGHRGVFRREPGAGRLPIIELRGPSIPRVAGKKAIRDAMHTLGLATLEKNLQHEVAFLRRGVAAGGDS